MSSVTVDPTVPASTENIGGGLGAQRIRNIAGWLLALLGQSSTAAFTFGAAPFTVDGSGNVTVTVSLTLPGNPSTALEAATKQYVDATALATGVATASGNAYAVTLAPVPTGLAALKNVLVFVQFPSANTGPATLNPNTLGATAIVKQGALPLVAGDISANAWLLLSYDGTNFQLLSDYPTTAIQGVEVSATAPTDGEVLRYSAASTEYVAAAAAAIRAVSAVASPGAAVGLTGSFGTVISQTVTLPNDGRLYRVVGLYSMSGVVNEDNASNVATGVQAQLTDGTKNFGYAQDSWSTTFTSGYGLNFVGISPSYTGSGQVITISLQGLFTGTGGVNAGTSTTLQLAVIESLT